MDSGAVIITTASTAESDPVQCKVTATRGFSGIQGHPASAGTAV